MLRSTLTAFLLLAASAALSASETRVPLQAWWVDSLQQVLVDDPAPASPVPGELHAARGEYEAIQVAVRSPVACRDGQGPAIRSRPEIHIRTVGRVPIVRGTHHTPKEDAWPSHRWSCPIRCCPAIRAGQPDGMFLVGCGSARECGAG
jgi:hypothetical protein